MSSLLLGLSTGCPSRDRDYDLQTPSGVPAGRPSGCVDTPFLGPDPYTASRGIDCTHQSRRTRVTSLRGKVVAEVLGALPGAGLEKMLVSVHASEGLPLAETTTDAQGAFELTATLRPGTYFVAVRAAPDQAALAIQKVEIVDGATPSELLLRVPP